MLNKNSKKDSYALPRIEELLDCLSGNRFFSVIDMKSGYHQVEIFEDHKEPECEGLMMFISRSCCK
jgi:hypothetical protein